MTAKIIGKRNGEEDILGLVTFGSLIANIYQITSKQKLEKQHGTLKAHVTDLKGHYDNMIVRYKQVFHAYQSMRNVNAALSNEVQTLSNIIASLREENNRLIKEQDARKLQAYNKRVVLRRISHDKKGE